MPTGNRRKRSRKPKPKRDNRKQSAQFIKAAKALGVDESGEAFKRALDKLVPKKGKSDGNN